MNSACGSAAGVALTCQVAACAAVWRALHRAVGCRPWWAIAGCFGASDCWPASRRCGGWRDLWCSSAFPQVARPLAASGALAGGAGGADPSPAVFRVARPGRAAARWAGWLRASAGVVVVEGGAGRRAAHRPRLARIAGGNDCRSVRRFRRCGKAASWTGIGRMGCGSAGFCPRRFGWRCPTGPIGSGELRLAFFAGLIVLVTRWSEVDSAPFACAAGPERRTSPRRTVFARPGGYRIPVRDRGVVRPHDFDPTSTGPRLDTHRRTARIRGGKVAPPPQAPLQPRGKSARCRPSGLLGFPSPGRAPPAPLHAGAAAGSARPIEFLLDPG